MIVITVDTKITNEEEDFGHGKIFIKAKKVKALESPHDARMALLGRFFFLLKNPFIIE
jgi:myosin heavy subunit